MRRKAPWVTLGPEPSFATCNRCGEQIPKPQLPKPVDAMVAWMKAIGALHAHCPLPVEEPTS